MSTASITPMTMLARNVTGSERNCPTNAPPSAPTTNQVNLLPDVYRKKKELKKKQPFLVAAVAALYLLVGLAWHKQDTEVTKL